MKPESVYQPNTPFKQGYYITDGGLETTLIFHHGLELMHFAAFELLGNAAGRNQLRKYYEPYMELARNYRLNFVFETPTWRANPDWGFKLGYSEIELYQINKRSVQFIRQLKTAMQGYSGHVVLSGDIGPRCDGYITSFRMTAQEAKRYHLQQVQAFAEAGVEVVTALTLNYSEEATGIVLAAKETGLPVVVSFTLETDGHLPCGESLQEAIERTDRESGGYAAHFMINCAHPTHFLEMLRKEGAWKNRIRGVRANASTKSHAELDATDSLDPGDKCLLANGYRELHQLLPGLKVIGGCCGTDHSHLEEICKVVIPVLM